MKRARQPVPRPALRLPALLLLAIALPAWASPGLPTSVLEPRLPSAQWPPLGSDPEVPLALWTNATYPGGLAFGWANGISFGDYDGDGFIDIFANQSGSLWRNLNGVDWTFAADLNALIPFGEQKYGSSFGDYNNDGLADIGTEQRPFQGTDDTFHLFWNLGNGPNFIDVATDPAIVDVQPYGHSETLGWADVNCDGHLDLFVPVYSVFGSPGNFFLFNLGPTAPGGAHRFAELSAAAGLDNPPELARPEGTQFVDVDSDGDLDLYSNGVIYRNVSTRSTPSFEIMSEAGSGIGLSDELDEGAMLFDYDMDGDFDLIIAYAFEGVRIWEAFGDGTFFGAPLNRVDDPFSGLVLGMSAADWDMDGDIDFTTREIFRRNRLMEDGTKHFTVATHTIPVEHQDDPTPAWGDWDKDGDQDCALANWGQHDAHLYENTIYGPGTAAADRRHLRVRPLGNSPSVAKGLENQYGAVVEIDLLNADDGRRRRQFTASGHGYLNQNEYTLHFALPADPAPADPTQDVRFDLTVDFPSLPSEGLWRVDKHINPVLGEIDLAALQDREIEVFKCGQVRLDGTLYEPPPLVSPTLITTAGDLIAPTASSALVPPTFAVPSTYAGLALNTSNATDAIRLTELIVDGSLDVAFACGPSTSNILIWDVTDRLAPQLVVGLNEVTASANRRGHYRADVVLEPGREYRVVARMRNVRATPIAAPIDHGPLQVEGGLLFLDPSPCDGVAVSAATPSPTELYLALRFDPAGIESEQADPLAEGLRLQREASEIRLEWPMLDGVAGYEIERCDATGGPCIPQSYANSNGNSYGDPDADADLLWYRVRALRDCSAASPSLPEPPG